MALRSMTRLVIAYLGDTQITGDVSSLKHVTKLKQLYLQRTGITGQISALQGMKDLQELLLQKFARSCEGGLVTNTGRWLDIVRVARLLRALDPAEPSGWVLR